MDPNDTNQQNNVNSGSNFSFGGGQPQGNSGQNSFGTSQSQTGMPMSNQNGAQGDQNQQPLPPPVQQPLGQPLIQPQPQPQPQSQVPYYTPNFANMPGMGAPGMGMPGMGTPGMGTPGMGTPGMGAPGMGAPGMGTPGMGAPGMGAPGTGTPGMGMPGIGFPAYPQQPEDTTPANFQLGTKFIQPLKVKIPPNELKFDEDRFLKLLAGSISLSKAEKKRIIDAIPKLRQVQIDELIRIFEEEKQKFAALSKKHVPQLEKLAQQHYNDWIDLELENEQQSKSQNDQAKAEEIRKQLGL